MIDHTILFLVLLGIIGLYAVALQDRKTSKERFKQIMEDFSKLKAEADATVADEEKVLAKIADLEAKLAAAQSGGNQAEIDAITKELADERAKIEAQP